MENREVPNNNPPDRRLTGESPVPGATPGEREGMLRALIDATRESLMMIDAEGTILLTNKVSAERFHGSVSDLIGTSLYGYLPPDLAKSRRELFNTVVSSAIPVQFIDVEEGRFYETFAYPIYEEERKRTVTRIAIFACDITERMKSEERIRESERRFREFVDQLPQTVSEFDMNGMHTFVNCKGFETFGFVPDDLAAGVHILDVIAREDRERAAANLLRRLEGEAFGSNEYMMMRKDGTEFPALVHTSPVFRDNKPIGFRSVAVDITEHRRALDAQKESEERYRTVTENSNDGIAILRGEEYVYVNGRFVELFGYEHPDDLTGRPVSMTIHPDDLAKVSENNRKRRRGGKIPPRCEMKGLKKDGTSIHLEVSVARTTYSGKPVSLIYLRDITERKSLEAQLRQSQKMEAIGQLAGGIAHDFNNILTALMGYAGLLQMNIDEKDRVRSYVSQILASSQRAANLTQGLLAFSRKQAIALRPCNVNTIIENVESLLRRLLTEDIDLRMEFTRKPLTVMADTTQIEQVILNLATNARDSMPQGGTLSINTAEVELEPEFAGINESGEPGPYALISVRDTGTGMDDGTKEKIFEPFFTTKEAGKGTGLGLAIVYGIVKQHNGYIAVSSEPGSGTVFSVYLPVGKTQAEPTPRTFADIRGGDETILIAEDNRDARLLTTEILTHSGYTVIQAVDGEDAIGKFTEHRDRISLLILDVVMPKKNGKEVFEAIRKLSPGIRTIFTSGYTNDIVLEKGILDKSVEFVPKPAPIAELLSRIRHVLDN